MIAVVVLAAVVLAEAVLAKVPQLPPKMLVHMPMYEQVIMLMRQVNDMLMYEQVIM